MLKDNASRDEIFESFPMLADMPESELEMLKDDCDGSDTDEDRPLVQAIEILLKRMGEDDGDGALVPA